MSRSFFTFLFFIFFASILHRSIAHASEGFVDLYSEGIYLNKTDNFVGFGHFRAGYRPADLHTLEIYGALRGSSDARSSGQPLGQILNDNFIFAGIGTDYLPDFIKGIRLRAQVGNSFDINNNQTLRSGFDYQGGLITYHESELISPLVGLENYSETLYVYRYRNLLFAEQARLLFKWAKMSSGDWTLGAFPLIGATLDYDSQGLDYNRFVDVRPGLRLSARTANICFSVTPEYVTGTLIYGARSAFHEFRLLGVAYLAF